MPRCSRHRLHSPKSLALPLAFVLILGAAGPARAVRVADLDVVFVLDTTGSMSGELREVQERVEQLAVSLSQAYAGARIRFGIVAYRDRGDEYVTRVSPLTEDVAASRAFLVSLRADGGGDGPESVVAGLAAAIREMSWDLSGATERQLFLIGDAPPHLDYGDEPAPEELVEEARRARIVVNAIGCRSLPAEGVDFFRRFAYATEGRYQHIGRVRAARSGALAEAVSRAVTSRHEGAGDGAEVPLTWTHSDAAVETSGILVRQGPPRAAEQGPGDAPRSCSLEVLLPPGLGLEGEPRARLGGRGLEVELAVAAGGEGGLQAFAMETCPPLATPVHVVLGGP